MVIIWARDERDEMFYVDRHHQEDVVTFVSSDVLLH